MKKVLVALAGLAVAATAQIPEQDSRNTNVPHTDTHFAAPVYASRQAWEVRAAALRKQILSAAGLLPMPEKGPVHAEVFGRLDRDGYSIEKVLLETYPGFYLGGNLYRPSGREGKFPAVATPHGHWTYGRFEDQPLASIPGRAINLARQGFVVFAYDMVGWNDTTQLPHGFGGPREALWSINVLGLQLWNSIRVVDFLSSLPEVDASRIAATGASGGGTQTFLLTAVDDRVRVAAPVNMISLIMQGGSQCENAPNLRVRANNVEIGALMAPRPLLMVAATGDWTKNTPREEFPAMQGFYRLLDAESNVESVQLDFPHNYNQQSREAVYRFFGERLLGTTGAVAEKPFEAEHLENMLALYGRSRPAGAVTQSQFISARVAEANSGIDALRPQDAASLARAREAFRERLAFSLLVERPARGDVIAASHDKLPAGETLVIGRRGQGDRIAAAWFEPRRKNPAAAPTLLVHPEGVAWALSSSESSHGLVQTILDRGGAVLSIDAFQTGHSRAPRDRSHNFFTTFNQTDDANRVQDILTAIEYLRARSGSETVNLVGFDVAGVWSYFARALADDRVNLAADLAQFRAATNQEYVDRFFVPGLRKGGDFRAAAVLASSGKVLLHNAGPEFPADWARASFQAAGSLGEVRETRLSEAELLNWIAPEMPAARRPASKKKR
jgi:dienelactone hydrolase